MITSRAILLTAPGMAAIAVVRLCGELAEPFLSRHFTTKLRPDVPVYGRLIDGDREIDDPVVIWSAQTQSADLCVHGGTWVVHEVLELAQRNGFETVSPGLPLSDLAVDADDPLEREILQWLPMARTREAIQTLLNQQQAWASLKSEISDPRSQIQDPRQEAMRDRSLHYLLHPPRIAIIGIPNAGKSTLANRIFGRDRSIVADLPGTTRDYVEDFANLGGMPAVLVDTPGQRRTQDRIESAAIAASEAQIALADLRILLLDPTQNPQPQEELAARYADALLVSGKADIAASHNAQSLTVSAATGEGMAELEKTIRRRFGCETLPHARPCVWTDRQRHWLLRH